MPLAASTGILSKFATRLSRLPSRSIHAPTEAELQGFKAAQRLAYQCVQAIEKEMQVGWSEYKTAKRMDEYLKDHGVRTYLHRPFAWFGEHARFDGYKRFTQFHPSRQKLLKADEPYILDVSPVVDGYIGDIGYSSALQPHPQLEEGMQFLLELREKLPGYFASDMTAAEIWWQLDHDIKARGFDNVHAKYPLAVLGHRVYRVPLRNTRLPRIPISSASWFSLQGGLSFLSHKLFPELLRPDHEGDKTGLWAIEPHLGKGRVGFKFEEILVVAADRAYWLDDQVPHILRKQAVRPAS